MRPLRKEGSVMIINELKELCLPRLVLICDKAGLSEKETNVILYRCNKRRDVTMTSYELGMCETCVKKYFGTAVKRIADYKNYLQIKSLHDIKN